MKLSDALDERLLGQIPTAPAVGIDIGSRQAKGALIFKGELYIALLSTGLSAQKTAEELLDILTKEAGIQRRQIAHVVGTGYGRVSLKMDDIPYSARTEISCHGLGAHYMNQDVCTVIDIGGQDSKAMNIDLYTGRVTAFAMNDKCAAGTGRFLENIARALDREVTEMGGLALNSQRPSPISSQCVVFAESEVISLRAAGESAEDIAAGIHLAVARRVKGLLSKVQMEKEILFTGGVAKNVGMRRAIEDLLGCSLAKAKLDTVYAGALGAAVMAAELGKDEERRIDREEPIFLSNFEKALNRNRERFIHRDNPKGNAGYLCTYTPLELFDAAGVSAMRLMEPGSPQELLMGESFTQSVYCDMTKSILGGFAAENRLYKAVDHIYSFCACDCMRATAEALDSCFVPVCKYDLPRKRSDPDAARYMTEELQAFRQDLEQRNGAEIPDGQIWASIRKYNKARKLLREIVSLLRDNGPVLTGRQFRQLMAGYFGLPVDELNPLLEETLAVCKTQTPSIKGGPRLMICGGAMAPGNERLIRILERLGAQIVAEDNCTGLKPIYQEVDENTLDPLEAIAKSYLGQPPCFRMYPNSDALIFSKKLAKEYRIDGVVFYSLKFCPCTSLVVKDYQTAFQKMGLPVLVVTDDYSTGGEGQLQTRLEAYMEIVRQKEVRG